MSLVLPLVINAEITQDFIEVEHQLGLYMIDMLKIVIGVFIIIGGIGFFITTGNHFAHWPSYIRRFFMGTFIFCNIFNQAFFIVFNVPLRKTVVCFIGHCAKKMLGQ